MIDQVGTVEILIARTYPIDLASPQPRTTAIVYPGECPLYKDRDVHFWMMEGVLNEGGVHDAGDGLVVLRNYDIETPFRVRFPSKRFGPCDWADFLAGDVCAEGPAQRLRIKIKEAV